MQEYSGLIRRLGNARIDSEGHRFYSVVTVGDKSIRDLAGSEYLDNFLQESSAYGREVTLAVVPLVWGWKQRNALATIRAGNDLWKDDPRGGMLIFLGLGIAALFLSIFIGFLALIPAAWLFWAAYCQMRFNNLVR